MKNGFLKHKVKNGQGTLSNCKSGLQILLLKSFFFPRYGVFLMIVSIFFSKIKNYKKDLQDLSAVHYEFTETGSFITRNILIFAIG